MRTYKEVLEDGIQLLETAAIEEARLDAGSFWSIRQILQEHGNYAHMDDGLDAKTEERYRNAVHKTCSAYPAAAYYRACIFYGIRILCG